MCPWSTLDLWDSVYSEELLKLKLDSISEFLILICFEEPRGSGGYMASDDGVWGKW